MKLKTLRHLGASIALVVASIIVTYITENLFFGVITFVGGGFLYLSGDAFIYQCRMLSTGFFANIGRKGHSSIIEADMFDIQSPYKGEPLYKVMMTGGSSVPILPFHGFGPVFICPKEYVKKDFHGAIFAIADWFKVEFNHLPSLYKGALVNRLEHFNPNTTDIYFADTSPNNAKMKSDVFVNLAMRCAKQEEIIEDLDQRNEKLQTALQSLSSVAKDIRSLEERTEQPKKYKMVRVEEQ